MIGEFLYQLTEKDARTAPVIQRYPFQMTLTQSALLLSPQGPPVPGEMIFVLTNLVVYALAGATQTVTSWRVDVEDETGQVITSVAREVGTAALERAGNYVGLNVVLMPNEHIEADVNFSANANPNSATLHMLGFFLPKGTIQHR